MSMFDLYYGTKREGEEGVERETFSTSKAGRNKIEQMISHDYPVCVFLWGTSCACCYMSTSSVGPRNSFLE